MSKFWSSIYNSAAMDDIRNKIVEEPSFGRPVKTRTKLMPILVAAVTLFSSAAYAETQQECLIKMKPNTTVAGGVAIGGAAGTAVGIGAGVAACSGALLVAFLDWGLSYGICVTTVAGVGTAIGAAAGTSVAEDKIVEERKRCAALPSEASAGAKRRYADSDSNESPK